MSDTQFFKLFKLKSFNLRLKSTTKDDALREIVGAMIVGEVLTPDLEGEAVKALLEREKLGSTGVGMNVAIPHVKLKGLARVACSLSVSEEGVVWQAVDGAPVNLFFTVLRPEKQSEHHDPERHLEMMKWIARLSRDADFRRFATRVKTKAELADLLKEKSGV